MVFKSIGNIIFCNFANAMTNDFYILLLCFTSGITFGILLLCALLTLRYSSLFRFQKIFVATTFLHSLSFLNNFIIIAFDHLNTIDYLNTLLISYDFCVAGCWFIFILDLIYPNRYKQWQLATILLPFVLLGVLFALTGNDIYYSINLVFTIALGIILYIVFEFAIRKHEKILENNVSNLEYFDLQWTAKILRVLILLCVLWEIESFSQKTWFNGGGNVNYVVDSLWNIICIWVVISFTKGVIKQKIFTFEPINENDSTTQSDILEKKAFYKEAISQDIDSIIEKNEYFLNKSLTLSVLANILGTNRQYLSNYINNEKHVSFYDYINRFRLKRVEELLQEQVNKQNQHSLEEIASLSGFNSYATFLRCFSKVYGTTPSKYLQKQTK